MNCAPIPNFSVPLPSPVTAESVPFHADPILGAIDRHSEAWSVYQVAAEGEPTRRADDEVHASLDVLLSTPCATRPGAFALLRHLRWWLVEEAGNARAIGTDYRHAQAREAELTLLLGCDGVQRVSVALPSGCLVSAPVQPVAPKRLAIAADPAPPATLARVGRALAVASELLAGVALVAGGCGLAGLASLA